MRHWLVIGLLLAAVGLSANPIGPLRLGERLRKFSTQGFILEFLPELAHGGSKLNDVHIGGLPCVVRCSNIQGHLVRLLQFLAKGMQEMGLTAAHAALNE